MAVGQWGGDINIGNVRLRLLLDGGHQVSVAVSVRKLEFMVKY